MLSANWKTSRHARWMTFKKNGNYDLFDGDQNRVSVTVPQDLKCKFQAKYGNFEIYFFTQYLV